PARPGHRGRTAHGADRGRDRAGPGVPRAARGAARPRVRARLGPRPAPRRTARAGAGHRGRPGRAGRCRRRPFTARARCAVGNVLAPAVVKRDHPRRIALLTACFTAVMSLTAATASGVAVPVSDAWGGGWRLPLAAFAGVIGVVALLWTARARRTPRPPRT